MRPSAEGQGTIQAPLLSQKCVSGSFLKITLKFALRKITALLIGIERHLGTFSLEDSELQRLQWAILLPNGRILGLNGCLPGAAVEGPPSSLLSLAASAGFMAPFQKTVSKSPISTYTAFSCE